MSFATFRDAEIVQEVIRGSMRFEIAPCLTWDDYQSRLLASRSDDFVDRIRHFAGVCSPSERCVLCAALATADYAWLDDEIAGTAAWSMFDDCTIVTRRAIAAAVLRDVAAHA